MINYTLHMLIVNSKLTLYFQFKTNLELNL